MCWLKRDQWKVVIAVPGILLLLVLTVWIPVSAAGVYEGTSGLATPITGTVQTTPTIDATVAALDKAKLEQEVRQLQQANDRSFTQWFWSNAATIVSSFLATLVVVFGGLFGLWRWRRDRQDAQDKELKNRQNEREKRAEDQRIEREKRAEERFQSVVEGLGSKDYESKVGAAILLRTFLHPDYERFYRQVFDLAVAHLRLRKGDSQGKEQEQNEQDDYKSSIPLDSLDQALITVFRESFPLARERYLKEHGSPFRPQSLDATGVKLDQADLGEADLKQVWMPKASLRGSSAHMADFTEAYLFRTDLSGVYLWGANFTQAIISRSDLTRSVLYRANLSKAILIGTILAGADLSKANLTGSNLSKAILTGANLYGASIEEADLLKDTDLRGVKELTKEQLGVCKEKGAILGEDTITSPPQSLVSPSPPSQNNETQTPSASPAQGSPLTPDTGGSGTTPSQQGPAS